MSHAPSVTPLEAPVALTPEQEQFFREVSDPSASTNLTEHQRRNMATLRRRFGDYSTGYIRLLALEADRYLPHRREWFLRVASRLEETGRGTLNAVPDDEFYAVAHS